MEPITSISANVFRYLGKSAAVFCVSKKRSVPFHSRKHVYIRGIGDILIRSSVLLVMLSLVFLSPPNSEHVGIIPSHGLDISYLNCIIVGQIYTAKVRKQTHHYDQQEEASEQPHRPYYQAASASLQPQAE